MELTTVQQSYSSVRMHIDLKSALHVHRVGTELMQLCTTHDYVMYVDMYQKPLANRHIRQM